MLTVQPLIGIPAVKKGDNLAALISGALAPSGVVLEAGDVIVVAQKVVSKTEGRQINLASIEPSKNGAELARVAQKDPRIAELILGEASEIMRATPQAIIARHRSGHVLANAGIDQSNLGDDNAALLWPEDTDRSARLLRTALEAQAGVPLAIIISDSMGRAWRQGTTGSAIGASGIRPLRDRRGELDLFGRTMQATLIAVADEIAAAASLVMGEAEEGIPAAVVRGAVYERTETEGINGILRPAEQDMFR